MAGAAAFSGVAAFGGLSQGALAQATPAANVPAGAIVSSVEGVPIAYTQCPEPFTSVSGVPGNGSTVRALILSYSPPPTPRNDNQFWQELETRPGVSWEPELVPVDSYGERIATGVRRW